MDRGNNRFDTPNRQSLAWVRKTANLMRKLLLNLHLYLALVVGLFVVVIGLSGSIIAFEPELDRLLNPSLFHVSAQGRTMSVDDLFQAAAKAYPGQKVATLRLPQSADDSVQFNVKGPKQVFMNPYTGAILGERSPQTPLSTIHSIHLRLLVGGGKDKTGADIVAFVTAVAIFLVLSGVYLWWPIKRIKVKWGASTRRVYFDLHNTVGIYSALFLLVLGITGLVIRFDDEIEEYLHHRAGTEKIAKMAPSTPQKGVNPLTPTDAVRIAENTIPGTQALAITKTPGPKGAYLVSLHFPEDFTPGGRSWVTLDQYSGKVLLVQNSRTVAMGTRAIVWNRRIHTGDLLGLPTKILMSLSCMMLIIQAITGYYMWWARLRAKQRQTEVSPEAKMA